VVSVTYQFFSRDPLPLDWRSLLGHLPPLGILHSFLAPLPLGWNLKIIFSGPLLVSHLTILRWLARDAATILILTFPYVLGEYDA